MLAEADTKSPYGLNVTKRLVVPSAEDLLFERIPTYETGHVTLVDYIGGDYMVERVATAGHGAEIFPEHPSQIDLLNHLAAKGIYTPFKSTQFKFHVQSSIRDAFHMVYYNKVSVNEYSGRYSELIDSAFLPSAEYLILSMVGSNEENKREHAKTAAELIRKMRKENFGDYLTLVRDIDLARELARIAIPVDNDTAFFWKVDLPDLLTFVDDKSRLKSIGGSMQEYLDAFTKTAKTLAPNATTALQKGGYEIGLTMPKDEDVVDPTPLPPKWNPSETRRVTVPELEEILFVRQPYLDHGAVQVVDYMGDDRAPVESARISYGAGTKRLQEDKHLIKYLRRHRHTTPFEHAELAVEGKVPVFVDPRQVGRHRTLAFHGFMGEIVLGSEYFTPPRDELRYQDRKNRQGRGNELDEDMKDNVLDIFEKSYKREEEVAIKLRELGVSEKFIRGTKGVGFYNFIWRTGNLHNWLHMLSLRLDPHAQKETRDYASISADAIRRQAPTTYQALMDYQMNAINLTAPELPAISSMLYIKPEMIEDINSYKHFGFVTTDKTGKEKLSREGEEFKAKLKKLNEIRNK